MSYTEISRKYHIDPRTAKKYAESETKPVYNLAEPKVSKLDPYKTQINMWLEEAPYSAARILKKLCIKYAYQKKDMVANPSHYRRLTIKQSFGIENTFLDNDQVIDYPIQLHNLNAYDEAVEVDLYE